jgi:hypothetical protein
MIEKNEQEKFPSNKTPSKVLDYVLPKTINFNHLM